MDGCKLVTNNDNIAFNVFAQTLIRLRAASLADRWEERVGKGGQRRLKITTKCDIKWEFPTNSSGPLFSNKRLDSPILKPCLKLEKSA